MNLTAEEIKKLGEVVNLSAVCDKAGVTYKTVMGRASRGQDTRDGDAEKILTTLAEYGLTYTG